MVEIYMEQELETLVQDPVEEEKWKALVAELGAEGQQALTGERKESGSPIPFPSMNEQYERVYKELCPNRTNFTSYRAHTIPVRVLEVIKLCQDRGYFKKLEVWDDSKSPDPIIVGYDTDTWQAQKFLVARWGDELRSFVELKEEASKRYLLQRKTLLTTMLKNVDSDVVLYFEGHKALYDPTY